MNVLVTGGTGFVGRRLTALLQERGHDVRAAGRRDGDLTDQAETRELFADGRWDVVFHLAAEVGGIGANQANPARYFWANLQMGLNVLEQARLQRVGKLVMVGTVCSYPKHTPTPFRETSLWDGFPEETNAPYGVAKRALIVGAEAFRAQHGLDVVTLLPANMYGPGDNFDLETSHVVPAMIRKLDAAARDGTRPLLWGDGSATREFLYVDDCARALYAAVGCGDPGPINLGTGQEISMRDLAGRVAAAVGYSGEVVWDAGRPNGQPRRQLEISRARELLGWEPHVELEQGLDATVSWWRSHSL